MTRKEALEIIYSVINSGIIDTELEDDLTEVANHICDDDFEMCDTNGDFPNYCEGCKYELS